MKPYIRLNNVSIQKVGNKVSATFSVAQTGESKVKKIGLYAHPEPSVGEPLRTVADEQSIEGLVDANTMYILEIDLESNQSLSRGKQYFFRVGALSDAGEAKLNYAKAIRIAQ